MHDSPPIPYLYLLRRTVVLATLLLCVTVYVVNPPDGCVQHAHDHANHGDAPVVTASSSTAPVAASPDSGFFRADTAREWAFPQDHGQHPAYQTEWWYYTGTLSTDEGRDFGVQVTIFRRALEATLTERDSEWATRDVYLGHFAIADLEAGQFHVAERVARGAADLAGASHDEHRVWVEGWRVDPTADGFQFDINAPDEAIALETSSRYLASPTLQGATPGLSIKSLTGQASYYYSLPRIPTSGTLMVDGASYQVTGELWMDHEFGTNQLAPDQVGWDWFAMQFADGRSLMLYQLRRRDGTQDPASTGTLIAVDGTPTHLPNGSFALIPGRTWRSAESNARYPVVWQVQVPAHGIDVTVSARMDDQELRTIESTGVIYWEGAIAVTGSHPGKGYLEMTGYSGSLGARF